MMESLILFILAPYGLSITLHLALGSPSMGYFDQSAILAFIGKYLIITGNENAFKMLFKRALNCPFCICTHITLVFAFYLYLHHSLGIIECILYFLSCQTINHLNQK